MANNSHPKYKPEIVAEALRQSGGIASAAAIKLGCSAVTVRNYISRHDEVRQAQKDTVESTLDLAETKLMKKISEGHMTALIFYLKTQGKHRGYVEGREVSGKGGGPVITEPTMNFDKLSLADKIKLRELHMKASNNDDDAPTG